MELEKIDCRSRLDLVADLKPLTHDWPLLTSPTNVAVICALYLSFVLKLGPKWMENRRPLTLKGPVLFYNASQVMFSIWWLVQGLLIASRHGLRTSYRMACGSLPISPEDQLQLDELCYYYFLSKIVELLDTVFFILRGKTNQVTFLHVYHHSNMLVFTWIFIKFIPGMKILTIGVLNTGVHVIMYFYYFLAALGPQYRPYLWWKKYLTGLQIAQFLGIITYISSLYVFNCNVNSVFIGFTISNTATFLILFSKFYLQSYLPRRISGEKLEEKGL